MRGTDGFPYFNATTRKTSDKDKSSDSRGRVINVIEKQNLPLKLVAHTAVADPEFPWGGRANSKSGCEKLLFGQFSPKTTWN